MSSAVISDIQRLALVIGCAVLVAMAALIVAIAATFAVDLTLSRWHFVVFPLVLFGIIGLEVWRLWRQRPIWPLSIGCGATALALVIAFGVASQTFDIGPDGLSDHQEGIIHLANNWNPFYDPQFKRIEEVTPPDYILRDHPFNDYVVLVAGKGTYYQSAAAMKFFGSVRYGKAFNLIVMLAALLVATVAGMRIGLSPPWAVVTGLAVAVNPIAVTQVFTTYQDGQMLGLLASLLALTLVLANERNWLVLAAFGASIILAINAKLPGLLFAPFLGLGAVCYLRYHKGKFRGLATYVAACVLGAGLVGYSPYVDNVVRHGNLFYWFDTYKGNETAAQIIWTGGGGFVDKYNRTEKFLRSIFAETHPNPDAVRTKVPFVITKGEIDTYRHLHPDIRIGGFGPWMGGALLVAVALMLFAFAQKLPGRWALAYFFGLILASTLAHPEAWWARFAPQAWLLPLAVGIFGARLPWREDVGALARVLLVIILLDAAFVTALNLRHQVPIQSALRSTMSALKTLPQPFRVVVANEIGIRQRFKEHGIDPAKLVEVDYRDCPDSLRFVRAKVHVCLSHPLSEEEAAVVEALRQVDERLMRAGLPGRVVWLR